MLSLQVEISFIKTNNFSLRWVKRRLWEQSVNSAVVSPAGSLSVSLQRQRYKLLLARRRHEHANEYLVLLASGLDTRKYPKPDTPLFISTRRCREIDRLEKQTQGVQNHLSSSVCFFYRIISRKNCSHCYSIMDNIFFAAFKEKLPRITMKKSSSCFIEL